jgi:hypothetical protein
LEADEAAERGGFGGAAEEKVEGQGTRGSRGAMCSVFCRRQTPRGVASPLGEDDLVGLKGQWVRFGPVRLNTFFFSFLLFYDYWKSEAKLTAKANHQFEGLNLWKKKI